MDEIQEVSEYAKMSVIDVLNMPVDLFQLTKKIGYMRQLQTTEEGQKYLKDCERYKCTEPDVEGLQKLQGKIGRG